MGVCVLGLSALMVAGCGAAAGTKSEVTTAATRPTAAASADVTLHVPDMTERLGLS
jgi:hypothetical protein